MEKVIPDEMQLDNNIHNSIYEFMGQVSGTFNLEHLSGKSISNSCNSGSFSVSFKKMI